MPIDPVTGTFIAGAVGGLIDGFMGLFGANETNKANMRLAQYQNNWNLQQWNRQNEYNSPSATIKRLVDAGVNPRAYNQLGQFANAQRPPEAVGYQKLNELSAFQGVARNALENTLLQAQINKTNKEADKTEAERGKINEEQDFVSQNTENLKKQCDEIQSRIDLNASQKQSMMVNALDKYVRLCTFSWSHGLPIENVASPFTDIATDLLQGEGYNKMYLDYTNRYDREQRALSGEITNKAAQTLLYNWQRLDYRKKVEFLEDHGYLPSDKPRGYWNQSLREERYRNDIYRSGVGFQQTQGLFDMGTEVMKSLRPYYGPRTFY